MLIRSLSLLCAASAWTLILPTVAYALPASAPTTYLAELHARNGSSNGEPPYDWQASAIGDKSWRQTGESARAFLKRIPPSNPGQINIKGSMKTPQFLWCMNPWLDLRGAPSSRALKAAIQAPIQNFKDSTAGMKKDSARFREAASRLNRQLLSLSQSTGVTGAKWIFYPPGDTLDEAWYLTVQSVLRNKFPHSSQTKVSTYKRRDQGSAYQLVVYISDWANHKVVKQVLDRMIELGVDRMSIREPILKPDLYTYADVYDDNELGFPQYLYTASQVRHWHI
jgi:hypothetical protein